MIHAITYCSNQYTKRACWISKQFEATNYIDTYKCYTRADLSTNYMEEFPSKWFSTTSKGGGWWVWKPYIIKHAIEQIDRNDVLMYIDCGCTLNNTPAATDRFSQYINAIDESTSKMLVFELPGCVEKDWTNMHCINTLKQKYNITDQRMNEYINKPQHAATVTIMKPSEFTYNLCTEWLKAAVYKNGILFSEQHTLSGERHRHDQSCLSMLYKIFQGDISISNETWFGSRGFGTKKSLKYPIWSTRLTKYHPRFDTA